MRLDIQKTLSWTMSKIHFESKSQLPASKAHKMVYWVELCQRYILKANHNLWLSHTNLQVLSWTMSKIHFESKSQRLSLRPRLKGIELNYVKDTFWKQITTEIVVFINNMALSWTMSKIHFESKSQQHRPKPNKASYWVELCQRYILKANHNFTISSINPSCIELNYVKDTFWKQITTES